MLRLDHNTTRFGSTLAVADVSLAFAPSEILRLVGGTGAGKRTWMSIAAGERRPDGGTVSVAGAVGMVHQHFMLVSEFTIAENLALTMGRLLGAADAERIVAASGIELRGVERRVRDLAVGEKAKLELIKAIARKP